MKEGIVKFFNPKLPPFSKDWEIGKCDYRYIEIKTRKKLEKIYPKREGK